MELINKLLDQLEEKSIENRLDLIKNKLSKKDQELFKDNINELVE